MLDKSSSSVRGFVVRSRGTNHRLAIMKPKNSSREKSSNLAINDARGHDQGVVKGMVKSWKIPRKSPNNAEQEGMLGDSW